MLLPIVVDKSSPESLQEQICEQLRRLIQSGAVAPRSRVPTSRELSRQHAISRNTVTLAYERLIGEGWLQTRPASGTFVADHLPIDDRLSQTPPPRAGLSQVERRPPVVHFSSALPPCLPPSIDLWMGGAADPHLFPAKEWRRHLLSALDHHGGRIGYPPPVGGVLRLRRAVSRWLAEHRGIDASPDEVLIVAGTQQSFNIAARLFIEPGETVVVESPGNAGAAMVFESAGARLVPIPVDENGIDTARLPESDAALCYVTPSHQFPLGSILSMARRQGLIEWARKVGAWILEDDFGGEFHYEGRHLPALKATDPYGLVIHCGSFSATLGAGLRLGYMVVPPDLMAAATAVKKFLDNGCPWLEQMALAALMEGGAYERHVAKLRRQCRERRNLMVEALTRRFGSIELLGMESGTHLAWLLPDGLPSAQAVSRVALDHGIGVHVPSPSTVNDAALPRFRDRALYLGYGSLTQERIEDVAARLGNVIDSCRGIVG